MSYVFLDTDERRRFAQVSHEYLITQTQFTGAETVAFDAQTNKPVSVRLAFNHPTKFLCWNMKRPSVHGSYIALDDAAGTVPIDNLYQNSGGDTSVSGRYSERLAPLHTAKLMLNGQDRMSTRYGSYFNIVQPWTHMKTKPAAGCYLYSFALRPDEHQPSGGKFWREI